MSEHITMVMVIVMVMVIIGWKVIVMVRARVISKGYG